MPHLLTAFLIISVVIVVNHGSSVTADDDDELLAIESKHIAVTAVPKNVSETKSSNQTLAKPILSTHIPEPRPPSKPPNILDVTVRQSIYYEGIPPHIQKVPPPRTYPKHPASLQYNPNSLYNYPKVTLPHHHRQYYYQNSRPASFTTSTRTPIIIKNTNVSLPQVVTGNRTDSETVKPPKHINQTSSTTTTSTQATTITTTQRLLRTKRIWPNRSHNKLNSTAPSATVKKHTRPKTNKTDHSDHHSSGSHRRVIYYASRNSTLGTTTVQPLRPRVYRPVTRKFKTKPTTYVSPINFTITEPDDWVPMRPSHYGNLKNKPATPVISKRSDNYAIEFTAPDKEPMYLQSFGVVSVTTPEYIHPEMNRKNLIIVKRPRANKPPSAQRGHNGRPRAPTRLHLTNNNLIHQGSNKHVHRIPAKSKGKVKHHHHHHHHRYIQTVEKEVKVPYKVEVPKPYPVEVEKKVPVPVEKIKVVEKRVPYAVPVEKQVPYPIGIRIPQPVPVKVIEKEYVPRPYPVYQQVVKHVEVKVPHPVPVAVPVDRPVPVAVPVEKRVPYPVPVKVFVPHPYAVERKVPYPVEVKVKDPVEIVKHVPIKVPYPQPYAVTVPQPVPVEIERRVPYPVETKVPVPVEVIVPQKVEVEKRVPIYIPKPYTVEKKVPYAVKVPYPVRVPVRVPVKVPVEVPVYVHQPVQLQVYSDNQHQTNSVYEEPVQKYISTTPNSIQNNIYNRYNARSDYAETSTARTSAARSS